MSTIEIVTSPTLVEVSRDTQIVTVQQPPAREVVEVVGETVVVAERVRDVESVEVTTPPRHVVIQQKTTDVVEATSVIKLGSTATVNLTAVDSVAQFKVVTSAGELAQPGPSAFGLALALTSAEQGSQFKAIFSGKALNQGWDFDVALPLFLGADGTIVQQPAPGATVLIGRAITPMTIHFAPGIPIISLS